jgi:hypothetical protein
LFCGLLLNSPLTLEEIEPVRGERESGRQNDLYRFGRVAKSVPKEVLVGIGTHRAPIEEVVARVDHIRQSECTRMGSLVERRFGARLAAREEPPWIKQSLPLA